MTVNSNAYFISRNQVGRAHRKPLNDIMPEFEAPDRLPPLPAP